MNIVSSSDKTICNNTCTLDCRHIKHQDYKSILRNYARNHTVNYNCANCFDKFVILNSELVDHTCDNFTVREILSNNFVLIVKHNYNDVIENYITCKHEHENPPPFFCSICCHKFRHIEFSFIEEYGTKINSSINIAVTTAFVTTINNFSNCNVCSSL